MAQEKNTVVTSRPFKIIKYFLSRIPNLNNLGTPVHDSNGEG